MRLRVFHLVVLALALIAVSGCGRKKIKAARPPRIGQTESGVASWYGYPYHGRRAANGEIYDMEKMTAAHRTLPFDTWVRVRNLSNSRTVDVRIQDRGPFINGRIIDLSHAAAQQISLVGPGTAKVRITVIAAPPKIEIERQPELFAVQVGAYKDRDRAEAVRSAMEAQFGKARIIERAADSTIYRVVVGQEEEEAQASALAERIRASGTSGFVVRLDQVGKQD